MTQDPLPQMSLYAKQSFVTAINQSNNSNNHDNLNLQNIKIQVLEAVPVH